jgi:Na+/H+-dicarboxylate symporter
MIFAFTSTSSAATLPVSKECTDKMGADSEISAFVLPLGATINMDGTAIYQCVATVFLATLCGMNLTLGQMITVVVTATLASIGTAGVSGAGMIMLAMVLEAMNIPVDMIMIIYGIDRLFDMGRTALNVTGDISCAVCVTKWEAKKANK